MNTISEEGLRLRIEVLEIVNSLIVRYFYLRHVRSYYTLGCQSIGEVTALLGTRGCENVSFSLDLASCDTRPISAGGFGDVYRGRLHDGSQVAIKTLRIHVSTNEDHSPLKVIVLSNSILLTLKEVQDAARELYKWSKCEHPNVIKLLGLVEFREQIGMVSLWMRSGSLPAYLDRHPTVNRIKIVQVPFNLCSYTHSD